jgi:hypothetical protein
MEYEGLPVSNILSTNPYRLDAHIIYEVPYLMQSRNEEYEDLPFQQDSFHKPLHIKCSYLIRGSISYAGSRHGVRGLSRQHINVHKPPQIRCSYLKR